MSDEMPEQSAKMVLNANRGITNIVEHKVISTDLQKTSDFLFKVLAKHYGPYSGYAALDENKPFSETMFTKDGIGIVRSIEFASPQEEWVRRTIAFIGEKMESAVGDGTTSAMMFTCAMIKHMAKHLDEIKPLSLVQFRDAFDRVLEQVQKYYDANKFAVNDPEHPENVDLAKVKSIAYAQVYTSTHGDKALAEALSEVYAHTAPELWERMVWERRKYESDERFYVEKTEGQYSVDNVDVWSKSMLNKDFGVWYQAEKAMFLVINDALRFNSPDWDYIVQCIKDSTEEQPVVILCHQRWDGETYDQFLKIANDTLREKKSVAVFHTDPANPRVNDYVALQLLTDNNILQYQHGEMMTVHDVKVTFRNRQLVLDHLYEVPEKYKDDPRLERHQFYDGEHSQYMDYLENVKTYANGMSKLKLNDKVREDQNLYYRMYAKLRYKETYSFVIGGKTHDNLALIDVVDDAMRATSRSLTNGVVPSNNRLLYHCVKELKGLHRSKIIIDDPIHLWILDRIKESLKDIADAALDTMYPNKRLKSDQRILLRHWWFNNVVDITKVVSTGVNKIPGEGSLEVMSNVSYFSPKTWAEDMSSNGNLNKELIVQPANSDISMLSRFAEVALKFLLTERIIFARAAYVDRPNIFKRIWKGLTRHG